MAIAKIEIELEGKEDNDIELDGVYYFRIEAAKASKNKIEYYLNLGSQFEYYANRNSGDTLVLAQAVLIVTTDSIVLSGQTIDVDGEGWWQDNHLTVKSFEIVDKFPVIK